MRVRKSTTSGASQPVQDHRAKERNVSDARATAARLSNRAHKLAKHTDGKVLRPHDEYDPPAPGVRIKSDDRIDEKAKFELGGRYDHIVDYAGIAIEYPTLAALKAGGRVALEKTFGTKSIERYRDRFEKPQGSGYSDVVANVRMANGHIVEVQLHVEPMLFAKQIEQVLYSERRAILAGAKADQHGRLLWLESTATAIYGIARQAVDAGRELTGREREFIASQLEFMGLHGLS